MRKSFCKYFLPLFCLFGVGSSYGQMFIPKFEPPQNLSNINVEGAEESLPLPYNNGESIYFVRTYIEGNIFEKSRGQEIYSASRSEAGWLIQADVFKKINDKGNNAVIGTSADGSTVYFFNSVQSDIISEISFVRIII